MIHSLFRATGRARAARGLPLFLLPLLAGLLPSCAEKADAGFQTPLLRDHGIAVHDPLDARLADWALKTYRDETPKLLSIQLRMGRMVLPHDTATVVPATLRFLLDVPDGEGSSGYQRSVAIPCVRGTDGSFTPWRGPLPAPDGAAARGPLGGISISCKGSNCSACKLKDVLRPSTYCDCTRVSNPEGPPAECNMEISMGLGALDGPEPVRIPPGYAFTPL
jgi:hypothetical protein